MKQDWLPSSLCAKIRAVDTCFVGCDRDRSPTPRHPFQSNAADRRDRRHWPGTDMALARH